MRIAQQKNNQSTRVAREPSASIIRAIHALLEDKLTAWTSELRTDAQRPRDSALRQFRHLVRSRNHGYDALLLPRSPGQRQMKLQTADALKSAHRG